MITPQFPSNYFTAVPVNFFSIKYSEFQYFDVSVWLDLLVLYLGLSHGIYFFHTKKLTLIHEFRGILFLKKFSHSIHVLDLIMQNQSLKKLMQATCNNYYQDDVATPI